MKRYAPCSRSKYSLRVELQNYALKIRLPTYNIKFLRMISDRCRHNRYKNHNYCLVDKEQPTKQTDVYVFVISYYSFSQ